MVLNKKGRYDRINSFGLRVTDEVRAVELLRQVPRVPRPGPASSS